MELFIFLGSLIIFLALGMPVFSAMGACAILLMLYLGFVNPVMMAQRMIGGVNTFVLMAIPFFIFAGEVMSKGGLGKNLVDAANVVIGRFRGGLGYTNTLQSIMFAGLSGSAVADVAMSGSLLYPMMVENGYKKERAMGAICASSICALIIPPSTPFIIMGSSVGVSIVTLFMAGIFPGILLGLVLLVTWYFIVRIDGYTDIKRYTLREGAYILVKNIPALFMPVLIIGGIRFGIFTPTEAGAFASLYAVLVCGFVYRGLNLKTLWECLVKTATNTAVVMLIVATASVVGWLIAIAQIPAIAVSLLTPLVERPLILLLTINLFLILIGMVLDIAPAILIFAPVLFPVVIAAGIDPIHFGVIMALNLGLGLYTPPIGTILFMGISVSKLKYETMIKGSLPFLAVEYGLLFLFVFFPGLILTPLSWIV